MRHLALLLAIAACGQPGSLAGTALNAPSSNGHGAPRKFGDVLSPTGGTIVSVTPTTGGGLAGGGNHGIVTLGLLTSCSSAQVLAWNGTAWACAALSGGLSGSGTTNTLPMWTSSTALGDSPIVRNGSFGNTTELTSSFDTIDGASTFKGGVTIGTASSAAALQEHNSVGATLGGGSWNLELDDITAAAQGNGGNVQFDGSVGGGTGGSLAAEIKASKTSATSADTAFDLIFSTSKTGGAGIGTALKLGSDLSATFAGQLHSVTDPTSAQDAATKNYVDTHGGTGTVTSIATTSPLSGGTITTTGTLTLAGCVSSGQTWVWNGSAFACSAVGAGTVTSSTLTANTIVKATGAGAIANSSVTDDGTTFKINSTKLTVTEASGNTAVAGTLGVTGAFTGSSTGSFAGALNMNTHLIDNVTDPSGAQDAATKHYVDTTTTPSGAIASTSSVLKGNGSGSAVASSITDNGTTVATTEPVSISGALNMNSHLIDSVTDPASAQDAATKHYVDTTTTPSGAIASTSAMLKGNGAGSAVASSVTDNGTTVSTSEPVTATGGVTVTGGLTTDALADGVITASIGSGTTSDWAPTGLAGAKTIIVTASGAATISSITGGYNGRELCLFTGAGSSAITITNAGTGSTGNKIATVNAASWLLTASAVETTCLTYIGTAGVGVWTQQGTFTFPQLSVATAAMTVSSTGVVTAPRLAVAGLTTQTAITASQNFTGQAASVDTVDITNAGTFNTTAAGRTAGGLNVSVTATRSTGSNSLANLASYFNAIGGQQNTALEADNGDVDINVSSGNFLIANPSGTATTTMDQATTINNTLTVNAALTADSTHRVIDTVGGTGLIQSANSISLDTSKSSDLIFGTGADGTLTYDGTTTILGMAPVSSVYTLTRSINAASITINSGVTIKTSGWQLLDDGTLTNNGVIQNNGGNGANGTTTFGVGGTATAANWYGASSGGGNGGTNGGVGSAGVAATATGATSFLTTGAAGTAGSSSVGGPGGTCSGAGGGSEAAIAGGVGGLASAANTLTTGVGTPEHFVLEMGVQGRAPFSTTTTFGAGGGGGAGAASSGGGGGGAGGGAVFVASRVIAGTGTISANGGNGGNGGGTTAGGGGGGAGGFAIVIYSTDTGSQSITATGGTGGTAAGVGFAGGTGGSCLVAKYNLSGDGT